jgi:mannonate dehydratase
MFRILLVKEILNHLLTLRLGVVVGLTVVLCSWTTVVGSLDFSERMQAYRDQKRETAENMQQATVYSQLEMSIGNPPTILSIFSRSSQAASVYIGVGFIQIHPGPWLERGGSHQRRAGTWHPRSGAVSQCAPIHPPAGQECGRCALPQCRLCRGSDTHLAFARHGYEFLRDHLLDRTHGGFHWSVDDSGTKVVLPDKHLYGQAFALYALAEFALATGEDEPKALAQALFATLEEHAHDEEVGGYREYFRADWTAMRNTGHTFHRSWVGLWMSRWTGNTGIVGGQPGGDLDGWGVADNTTPWSYEMLCGIKREIEEAGLIWEAIENFDPAHWHDVLLDGPKREQQMESLKRTIQNIGKAGITTMGYNFSLAGVAGRVTRPVARGGAQVPGMDGADVPRITTPMKRGMVWNMTYDQGAPDEDEPTISHDELWERLAWFLERILPIAEEAGVDMALHPDAPPLPMVRNQPRLVYQHHMYQRLLELNPSPHNGLEFCVGTLAEMSEGDIYECIDNYTAKGVVKYIHLRNVRGRVPHYHETFIDDGDLDVKRIFQILHRNRYDGLLIPDHAPEMTCDAPWHAGMAFAMGYLKGMLTSTADST